MRHERAQSRGGRRGRGTGRVRRREVLGSVEESALLAIEELLQEFLKSDETELMLPSTLSRHERRVLHSACRKYGLSSKSRGRGALRQATVSKQKTREDSPVLCAHVTDRSRGLIESYLQRYPANDVELLNLSLAEVNAQSGAGAVEGTRLPPDRRRIGSASKSSAFFPPAEIEARHTAWLEAQQTSEVQPLKEAREGLPIASMRESIIQAVAANQVILVAGETGCGKTTQVPQYILEHAWGQGKGCKIICTQPRRISAITIAERIAAERGEAVGVNVGYTIRLESCGDEDSAIMMCTNGVLLRMLTHGGMLAGVTHIICDEVHERDKFADFLVILLRELLPRRPDLRLVLMSATLHSELFASYYGGCPVVSVPGMTHPVADVFLDEILPMLEHQAVGSGKPGSRSGQASLPATPSPEQQGELDDALYNAFVEGSDESFAHLVEITGDALKTNR